MVSVLVSPTVYWFSVDMKSLQIVVAAAVKVASVGRCPRRLTDGVTPWCQIACEQGNKGFKVDFRERSTGVKVDFMKDRSTLTV